MFQGSAENPLFPDLAYSNIAWSFCTFTDLLRL